VRVEIQQLLKSYHGKAVVDIPSLTISACESVGIVGNNGAGKTTLLRLILDLVRPDRGTVRIDGMPSAKTARWKRSTAVYLGEEFLVPFLTPREYFYFIGDAYDIPREEVEQRLHSFEPFLPAGAARAEEPYIRELSDGNKQKTGILGALLPHPGLLIFDEPFLNLDPSSQSVFKRLLNQFALRQETTVLLSSHNLTHLTEVCDRILLLEEGRVMQDMTCTGETADQLARYFDSGEE